MIVVDIQPEVWNLLPRFASSRGRRKRDCDAHEL